VKNLIKDEENIPASERVLKPVTFRLVIQAIFLMHELLCIFRRYDEKFSRPTRFILSYSKTVMILSIQALVA
jgi:hypothetical protein